MRSPIDPFMPAVELAAAIRHRELSPVEVVDCYLDRMDELDPRLNAFCHRADGDVRKAASAAADAVVRAESTEDLPPFHGVPLPIKDLVDVTGWPATHGSAGASHAPAAGSDPVVQRFVDAGFVLLGKTTTSEFGTVPFTESEALGISRNPWDPDRTPGGSSGGAGAAVAAGMAPIAHAADGGGSIRIPASCTGLVGLKPTRGLVTNGIVKSEGFATNGVLTRTVADTAAAVDVLARHDPAAWWSPPTPQRSLASAMTMEAPTGLRIGVLADSPIDGLSVDPACADAVDVALRTLESAGHHVVDSRLPLPPSDELVAAFTTVWNVGGAGVALADPNRVEPHNRALRDAARAIDSWAYTEGVQRTQLLSRRIVDAFVASVDLVVTPTMACLPPPVGAWRAGTDDNPLMALVNSYPMAVFTSLFNVTGQPAISVPVGRDDATGLPVGVQVVAAPWRETSSSTCLAPSSSHTPGPVVARPSVEEELLPTDALVPGRSLLTVVRPDLAPHFRATCVRAASCLERMETRRQGSHAGRLSSSCTSCSFVRGHAGEQRLAACMRDAGAPAAVTTSGALVDALHALSVTRVAAATPYDDPLTDLFASWPD